MRVENSMKCTFKTVRSLRRAGDGCSRPIIIHVAIRPVTKCKRVAINGEVVSLFVITVQNGFTFINPVTNRRF